MKKLWEEVFLGFILKGILATAVAIALLLYLHPGPSPRRSTGG